MNKLATVITVSLTALTLTACGGAKAPEDTATAFVKAAYTNDSKAVLDMLYFDESIGEEGKADVKGKIEQLVEIQAKKAEKVKEVIYGIKVSKGINQTLIWKGLKKVCELKNEEGTKIAKELKEKYPIPFEGAVRCLVSKKRINYINSIC